MSVVGAASEDLQFIAVLHDDAERNRIGDILRAFDTSFQYPVGDVDILVAGGILQSDAFAIGCTVLCNERRKGCEQCANNADEYVLMAMGPFLIFLLNTLPSSLPNDGGAGSTGRTCSTGC